MLRSHRHVTRVILMWQGIVRSPWRSLAGFCAAVVTAGAFLGAGALLTGMGRVLESGLERLGADLVVAPRAYRHAVERWLVEGTAPSVPTEVPGEWRHRLEERPLVGVREIVPWDLTAGGQGHPAAGKAASVLLIRLERWGQPMMVLPEVEEALPEAAVVVAEQVARRVARDLQPVVRYLAAAAGGAWVGLLLMVGVLTAVQVAERRRELGMLRAVGASRRALVALVLGEVLCLAAAGAVAGTGLALGALVLAPRELTGALAPWDYVRLALTAVGLTLATALAAATGPALRAAWMDPLAAVQQGR
ncbi:MAG TPA: ABC transporter permease [Symbiobacteriaceae bacterium]